MASLPSNKRINRKMDMLNADLFLATNATAKASKGPVQDDQAGFHFIAFVPVGEHVWKLDGLERQPAKLGAFIIRNVPLCEAHSCPR